MIEYTTDDVARIVREIVTEYGHSYVDHTNTFFSRNSQKGSCFVGVVLEKLGITPDRVMTGDLYVSYGGGAFRADAHLISKDIARIDHYTFRDRVTGESFRFERGIGSMLYRSMSSNDAGTRWGDIAKAIWGISTSSTRKDWREEYAGCNCPLCTPQAVYDPVIKITEFEKDHHYATQIVTYDPVTIPTKKLDQLVSAF